MEIYVVQRGDDIYSIANRYGISVVKLVYDNGLDPPYSLTAGQTLVIAYPKLSHTVQEGDSLQSIAASYHVTPMQILRNNSYLTDRKFLYPGETLVISYDTKKSITTNGFAYPFIKRETLIKTLPSLTYLSVYNYTLTEKGVMTNYTDDTEIIKISKEYGAIPLMLLSTLTPQGEPNVEAAYRILLSEKYQERNMDDSVNIIKSKGYSGINLVFNYLNNDNQILYRNFVQRIAKRLQQEGFLFFITINYKTQLNDNEITIEKIDYSAFDSYVNGMIFLRFTWGTDYGPPAPVSNINYIETLIDYVSTKASQDKIIIGKPTISYDWQLPYIPNKSNANSLSLNTALNLALEFNSTIEFDEDSQTPYFYYDQYNIGLQHQHIVWFIDAKSIDALNKIIIKYGFRGSGIWNIMIYNSQLWTITNVTFDIIKLI